MSPAGFVSIGLLSIMASTPTRASSDLDEQHALKVTKLLTFKNGYAFVTREGRVAVDDHTVRLSDVPQAVMGTYWGYVSDEQARLRSISARIERYEETVPALHLTEMLTANVGAAVRVTETDHVQYTARILSVPRREQRQAQTVQPAVFWDAALGRNVTPPAHVVHKLDVNEGSIVILDVLDDNLAGTRVVPLSRVVDLTFVDTPELTLPQPQERPQITMHVDAGGVQQLNVGVVYVQNGFRWIPEYTVRLRDDGTLALVMQATLINELADLDHAEVHLAVGVPNILFEDQLSPMAMSAAFNQLNAFFRQPGRQRAGDFGSHLLSNALMSQVDGYYGNDMPAAGTAPSRTELLSGPAEDLYIYRLADITLKKGARMIVPVFETTLEYDDHYVWDVTAVPPAEALHNINHQQYRQLQKELAANRIRHVLQLSNDAYVPFTTGPAMILQDGQLIAQSLLTYTPIGGTAEIDLTVATDIRPLKIERELERTPNALKYNGHDYTRVDLSGELRLTSHKKERVKLTVRRHLLGRCTRASHGGSIAYVNTLEDYAALPGSTAARCLSSLYNVIHWPSGWHATNTVTRIDWNLELDPGEQLTLTYQAHYFVY